MSELIFVGLGFNNETRLVYAVWFGSVAYYESLLAAVKAFCDLLIDYHKPALSL